MSEMGHHGWSNQDTCEICLRKDRDALLEQLRLTNIDQLQCEAERDRYKEALKTIEALNHSGHYIEGEPGEHENKGCLASDLAQSALAQTEGA